MTQLYLGEETSSPAEVFPTWRDRQWDEGVSQMWLTETKAQPVPDLKCLLESTCGKGRSRKASLGRKGRQPAVGLGTSDWPPRALY